MSSLVRAEFARVSMQPVVRAMLVVLLAAAVLAAAETAWQSRPASATETARAHEQFQNDSNDPGVRSELKACRKNPGRAIGAGSTEADCTTRILPKFNDYLPRAPLSLRRAAQSGFGLMTHLALALCALLLGIGMVGADWSSGAITNLVLTTPRRRHLWLAKLGTWTAATLILGVLALTAYWLPVMLVARSRDLAVRPFLTRDLPTTAGHVLLLAAMSCAAGFALATLARNAAVALVLVPIWWVATGPVLSAVGGGANWALGANLVTVLRGTNRVYDRSVACSGASCEPFRTMHADSAVTYLLAAAAILLSASLVSFTRRDM